MLTSRIWFIFYISMESEVYLSTGLSHAWQMVQVSNDLDLHIKVNNIISADDTTHNFNGHQKKWFKIIKINSISEDNHKVNLIMAKCMLMLKLELNKLNPYIVLDDEALCNIIHKILKYLENLLYLMSIVELVFLICLLSHTCFGTKSHYQMLVSAVILRQNSQLLSNSLSFTFFCM